MICSAKDPDLITDVHYENTERVKEQSGGNQAGWISLFLHQMAKE